MRRLAFLAVVAAIALAALLLDHREGEAEPSTVTRIATPPRAILRPGPREASDLDADARGFVLAFLDLESRGTDPATRAGLRRHALPRLADRLLADAPTGRPDPGLDPPAIMLHAARLSHRPDLALVTGTAGRAGGPEPFAFLLALREGRWLAVAPAE